MPFGLSNAVRILLVLLVSYLFPITLVSQMQRGWVPIDRYVHDPLIPPALLHNQFIRTRQYAPPAELRPVADGTDLSAPQDRLQRERKGVPQRIVAGKHDTTTLPN